MDRPDEFSCHRCGRQLGWINGDRWVRACEDCGVLSQPGPREGTIEATPAVIRLQRELDELERRFREDRAPLRIRVGGSLVSPGRDFDPDVPGVDAGLFFALAVAVAIGGTAAAFGQVLFGLGLIAVVAVLFAQARRVGRRRREAFQTLEAGYRADRERVTAEIRRELGGPE